MKINRFNSGIPELHNPSICNSLIRLTIMENACFSNFSWDSLFSIKHPNAYMIVYSNKRSFSIGSSVKPFPYGSTKAIKITATTKFIP